MLKKRTFAWFGLLFAVGCQLTSGTPWERIEPLASDETITIHVSSGSSTLGSLCASSTWDFQATGACEFTDSSMVVAVDTAPPSKTKTNWQSKMDYQNCKALLRRIQFFHLKEEYGELVPGGHSTCVHVTSGKSSHEVRFQTDAPPEAIASLMTFLEKCVKNAEASAKEQK